MAAWLAAPPAAADGDFKVEWSATLQAMLRDVSSPEDANDVTNFFDQYEYTPNKQSGFPIDLGVSDLALDVFGAEDTPLLQLRLRSPTSNLGVSGADIDKPFLNDRVEIFARPEGIAFDFDFRRFRTDDLRLFPRPSDIPGVCPAAAPPPECEMATRFNDQTEPNDRFSVRRTLFGAQVRVRPKSLGADGIGSFLSEAALRGGFEARNGDNQFRFMLGNSDRTGGGQNDFVRWRAVSDDVNQDVAKVGGGLVFTPGGLATIALDFDHERFRNDAPTIFQTELSAVEPLINIAGDKAFRTVHFIPDTDRYTGSLRLHTRLGDRGRVHGGFQVSHLKRVGTLPPNLAAAIPGALDDNAVRTYSANVAADLELTQSLSANAFFKWDRRNNRIDRSTSFFNRFNGTQLDEFLDDASWIRSGAELVYRFHRRNRIAIGYRNKFVDRALSFANSGTSEHTLPRNAAAHSDSQRHAVYARSVLRPFTGFRFSSEAGYENATQTSYTRELDDVGYFKIRSTYTLPLARPLTLSFFGRGEFGENDDFRQISESAGFGNPNREFSRDNYSYGFTLSGSPCDQVTLFASFFQHRDAQNFDLVRSNAVKFEEPTAEDVNFVSDAPLDYRANLSNVLLGGNVQLGERTDLDLSYSFTRSDARFTSGNPTKNTINGASEIQNDIHSLEVGVGHLLTDGLRVSAGYRLDRFVDHTNLPSGTGSVVSPFGHSMVAHTITLGVTLTSDLLKAQ